MADLISWERATQVASRLARYQPALTEYERRSLEADFQEMTAQAEELVAVETGLRSRAGPARARVADRTQWVNANVASFERLLRPVIDKLEARLEGSGHWSPVPVQVSRQMTGAELGLVLGWMSTRVLGQYDQLIVEEENPEDQDIIYYVGPNIASIERRHGFPPGEFRLWLALHEVTHRAQFTGVPWMRAHFLSLVDRTMAGIDLDPKELLAALRRSADSIRAGRNPLEEGGLIALIATPAQHDAIQEIAGMMSLLEGHGDITMDRAGADRIPNAPRFSEVLRQRRRQRGLSKVFAVLVGLDAKLRQYEQGENFIEAVEKAGGPKLLTKVWEGPEMLPSWSEIKRPQLWIDRASGAGTARVSGNGSVGESGVPPAASG